MLDFRKMSRKEVRRTFRLFAIAVAMREYRKRHPEATEEDAFAWACRHWRKQRFKDRAMDALITGAIVAEMEEVARLRLN
jgi:hypothetical protein